MKIISGILKLLAVVVDIVIVGAILIAVPYVAGYRPVIVLSPSMVPAYPVGSIIYYKAVAFEDIRAGDAITFYMSSDSEEKATHRVVEVNEEERSFVTKGDANPGNDPVAKPYDDVVGKTAKIAIPYAGFAVDWLKKWYVIAGMLLILVGNMFIPGRRRAKNQ